MKYCRNCGNQMEDAAAFCPSCGTPVAQPPQAPPVAYAPQPPMAPQPQEGDPAAQWPSAYAQPPKRKPNVGLIVGIAAGAAVLAVAALLLVLFLPRKPSDQFASGMQVFAQNLFKLPSNEVTSRMQKENYDLSMSTDLSDLLSQVSQGQSTGMPDNTSLTVDIKNTGKTGGARVAMSSGGTDIFKLVAAVTDDKLIAGYASPMLGSGDMQAAALKLNGKPGDPLQERLAGLSSKSTVTDQKKQAEVGQKLLQYIWASVDGDWFTTEKGSIEDAISGKTVQTSAVTLTLDAERTVKLLKNLKAKLDADPTVYDELDSLMAANGTQSTDSKEQLKQLIEQAEQELQGQDFKVKIVLHSKGSTPVALQVIYTDKQSDDAFMLQKATSGNSSVYLFTIDPKYNDESQGSLVVKLKVDYDGKQYKVEGNFDLDASGDMTVHVGLNATADIQKKSSNEYTIDTKATVNWNGPEYALGTGSVDAALQENVQFGAGVKNVQDDKDYDFDALTANAKEVDTMEEFVQALAGSGALSSLY